MCLSLILSFPLFISSSNLVLILAVAAIKQYVILIFIKHDIQSKCIELKSNEKIDFKAIMNTFILAEFNEMI